MRQRGFTYLGLMILVTIIGLVGAASLKMGTLMQRAAAEEDLLEIGAQFSEALRSYAAATPQGQPQQPPSLQELLKDPRSPNPRRHLRKIFVDPVTGKAEWGIMYLSGKVGVVGVYSLSNRRPLKVANFDIRFQNMENRERISDWKFMMAGGSLIPAVVTPPNSMTAAPSLFPPGAPDPKGAPAAPLSNKPAEPLPDAPPQEGAPAEPAPEQNGPMEAPPEEQQEGDAQPVATDGAASASATTDPKPVVPAEGQHLKR